MAFDPKQWRREKGSARGYINVKTGRRLSRRQYDKLKGGPKPETNAKRKRAAKAQGNRYRSLVRDTVQYMKMHGEDTNYNKLRSSDKMKKIVRDLKLKKGEDPDDPKVFERRRAALEATGRREGVERDKPLGESDPR